MALRLAVVVSCAWQLSVVVHAGDSENGVSEVCFNMITESVGVEKAEEIRKECAESVGEGAGGAPLGLPGLGADASASDADKSLAHGLGALADLAKNLAATRRSLSEEENAKGQMQGAIMQALGGLQGAAFVACEAARWAEAAKALDGEAMAKFTECMKEHPAAQGKSVDLPAPMLVRQPATTSAVVLVFAAFFLTFGGMVLGAARSRNRYLPANSVEGTVVLTIAENHA